MMPISMIAEAIQEMRDAAAFYEDRREGLGQDFLNAIREGIRKVQGTPNRWPAISVRSRRHRIDRFPYGLVYQIVNEEILVLAVMHLLRHPDYWKGREQ